MLLLAPDNWTSIGILRQL